MDTKELRHSFVSLLSSAGIPIEDIAHLVGHANTRTAFSTIRRILTAAGLITPGTEEAAQKLPTADSKPTNPTSAGNLTSPTGS
jgi:hypothetical protein